MSTGVDTLTGDTAYFWIVNYGLHFDKLTDSIVTIFKITIILVR